MSIDIRSTKLIAVLSFLLISGVQQNGVPNFALLLIYLFQFLNDVFSSISKVFWEGLIAIPIFSLLILFLISKNYRVLLICFFMLFVALTYITGIIGNLHRIGFTFVIPTLIFLVSSIYVIVSLKRRNNLL
ncbi:hypothetical protein FlaCF_0953 [Flavobacterium tructae]